MIFEKRPRYQIQAKNARPCASWNIPTRICWRVATGCASEKANRIVAAAGRKARRTSSLPRSYSNLDTQLARHQFDVLENEIKERARAAENLRNEIETTRRGFSKAKMKSPSCGSGWRNWNIRSVLRSSAAWN